MDNHYYVYAVFVEKKLKYIGKGKGSRFEHGCSGCSHVFGLNECFFDGKLIEVGIVKDNLTDDAAQQLELGLIWGFGNSSDIALYNSHGNNIPGETYPNMEEAEFYAGCNIVRSTKYVRGEFARSKPSVYNDRNRGHVYPW